MSKWPPSPIRDNIVTATQVPLADGWVEVVTVDAPALEVIVGNGTNRHQRIPISRVLETRNP